MSVNYWHFGCASKAGPAHFFEKLLPHALRLPNDGAGADWMCSHRLSVGFGMRDTLGKMKNYSGISGVRRPGLKVLTVLLAALLSCGPGVAAAQDASPGDAGDVVRPLPRNEMPKPDTPNQPDVERKTDTAKAEPSGEVAVDVSDPSDGSPRPVSGDADQSVAVQKPAQPVVATALVVQSWAGAYGAAQERAIIEPLARDLDMKIERRTHRDGDGDGGGGPAAAGVDVLELDQSAILDGCVAGQLLKLDSFGLVKADAVAAGRDPDFIGNAFSDCGIPTFAWSSMLIANGEAMRKLTRRYREPGELAHLLDVKTYPGKRALIRSPQRVLEMMLIGTGVGRDEVYAQLATRQGQDAAFKALDGLSSQVIWVDGPREALLALDAGTVTMAMTFSGRAFRRLIAGRLLPIWDGHIIDYASWAVPASSQNREKAGRFILAATTAEQLAAQARLWPYGPMRRSALPLALRHDLIDTELASFMPTSDLRFGQGLLFDAVFWAKHGAALQDRFEAFLVGVPLGIRVPPPRRAPPPPVPPLPRQSAG